MKAFPHHFNDFLPCMRYETSQLAYIPEEIFFLILKWAHVSHCEPERDAIDRLVSVAATWKHVYTRYAVDTSPPTPSSVIQFRYPIHVNWLCI